MNRAAAVASLLALLAIACGSPSASRSASAARTDQTPSTGTVGSPPPTTPTSTSATFSMLPAPAPAGFASQISCNGSIGSSDPVAIVRLRTGGMVLRDYAVPGAPKSVCVFATEPIALQLIDARHIVIASSDDSRTLAVVDLPAVRYHWFRPPGESTFAAVGPRLDQVTWLSFDVPGGTDKVHVTTSAGDHVVAVVPSPQTGRGGSCDDSKGLVYSHSGDHLFVLHQPVPDINSLIVIAGQKSVVSILPPSAGWPGGAQPEMAIWSPVSDALFYGQGGDVWRWTPGSSPQRYLTGIRWNHPTISPDGRFVAYSVLGGNRSFNYYVVDLVQHGAPQLIGGGVLSAQVFLTSTLLLQSYCGLYVDKPPVPQIYDLSDSSQSPSVIDFVSAVWPATSSNF